MLMLSAFEQQALGHTSYSVGALGERVAASMLQSSGYDVMTNMYGHDLTAISRDTGESFRVEVKAARRNKRREWCFTLRKNNGISYANHLYSDVVLLLSVLKSGRVIPFVIPVQVLRDKRAITITSHPLSYAGMYARFRQSPQHISLEG
jgi:hypothetical protein